jgi:hypothetical protein
MRTKTVVDDCEAQWDDWTRKDRGLTDRAWSSWKTLKNRQRAVLGR